MHPRSLYRNRGLGTTTASPQVQALANAIARQERGPAAVASGVFPNNNPGDIMQYSNGSYTLVSYASLQDGWNALYAQINRIVTNYPGITLDQFFAGQRDASGNVLPGGYPGYASAQAGNDPALYAANVSGWTGIPQGVALTSVMNGSVGQPDTLTPVVTSSVTYPTDGTDPSGSLIPV